MKKWWVKLLLVLVFILLALSTWFIGSGTQSRDMVERYRKQLLAAGERLDIDAFTPPRVDPDKNGAALFDKAGWYIAPRGMSLVSTNPPTPMEIVAPAKARVLWQQDEIISVKYSRQSTNTWTDIEGDLANQNSAVELLQQAAAYPEFDFGIDYHQPSAQVPHVSKLREAVALLSARVIFDLHHGDTDAAARNLHTLLMIANAGKNEPIISSQIMRAALLQTALAVQWEFLQATNLTDEQLSMLQTNWMGANFVKPAEITFLRARTTIPADIKGDNRFGPRGHASIGLVGGGFNSPQRFVRSMKFRLGDALWRESWCYDDELRLMELCSVMADTMRQAETNGYFKDALASRERQIVALGLNRTNADSLRNQFGSDYADYTPQSVRALASQMDRMISVEAWRKCAVVAIALKRYELRRGTLPKELNALVPDFLSKVPRDPIDERPLRYRLNADRTFLLYSIGVDGVDDGGDATAISSSAFYSQWQLGRDWVWPQPATSAEIKYYYDHPPK